MIRKNLTRRATLAEELMAVDVFADLLATTDPAHLGKRLTEQLREITGAKTAILASHVQLSGMHEVVSASPERRAALFTATELALFCPECVPESLPRITADFPDDHPIKAILAEKGIESVLRFPLRGNNELVGTLYLLDLPGIERVDETVSIVTHLAPVIALALRNALSHKRIEKQAAELEVLAGQLEKKVADRTSQLEESNRSLNRSLREKETLLRELYHRTKNTLQVIGGILKLQAAKFPDNEPISELVEITDNRIQAIALVHQMLYSSRDLSHIPIESYIADLIGLIRVSHGEERVPVSFSLDIEKRPYLLDTAIPLGLVLTELVTNTYKYAFEQEQEGQITIRLEADAEENTTLTYSDNGRGLPDGFDFRSGKTLGMLLISNIVEQQLRGSVEFPETDGLTCLIKFPKALYSNRV